MRPTAAEHIWSKSAGNPAHPLVILVHGTMDRSAGMIRLSRCLDHEFRVLRYDRRGYAKSRGLGPPYQVPDQVDDLAELISAEPRHQRAALVFGHSFGGNVALALADRHPDLVDKVAVYEAPLPWIDGWRGRSGRDRSSRIVDPGDAAEAFMRRLIGASAWESLSESKRADRRAEGSAMIAELADLSSGPPWSRERIQAPILAMYGSAGRLYHQEAMQDLTGMLDNCCSVSIRDATHAGPHSHANLVADRLAVFVADSRGSDE